MSWIRITAVSFFFFFLFFYPILIQPFFNSVLTECLSAAWTKMNGVSSRWQYRVSLLPPSLESGEALLVVLQLLHLSQFENKLAFANYHETPKKQQRKIDSNSAHHKKGQNLAVETGFTSGLTGASVTTAEWFDLGINSNCTHSNCRKKGRCQWVLFVFLASVKGVRSCQTSCRSPLYHLSTQGSLHSRLSFFL